MPETPRNLPRFSLADYAALLKDLAKAGYVFQTLSRLGSDSGGRVAYIRHDIDLHLHRVDEMARLEADLGVAATYYILLTQHYNPLEPGNRRVIANLVDWGHEIGLHYDLAVYPEDAGAAAERLRWEMRLLGDIAGTPVRTIAAHQPSLHSDIDPFLDLPGITNPQDRRLHDGLLYVSDSCRAWRDLNLLRCFGDDPPRRLILTTHPESWLDGAVTNRIDYLHRVVLANGLQRQRQYLAEEVERIWRGHAGARAHDARENTPPDGSGRES